MVVIVITVAVRGPGVEFELKGDPTQRWTFLESGFFEAIGVISFAFVVSRKLGDPSFEWWMLIAFGSRPRSATTTRVRHPLTHTGPSHLTIDLADRLGSRPSQYSSTAPSGPRQSIALLG